MLRAASFAGASAFMTSSPLIAKLSQSDAGAFDFSIISATLFAELAKLAFSLGALLALGALRRHAHGGSVLRALRSLCPLSPLAFGKYSVPSLVYALNNNLVLHILTLISPTLFQVFACLKTIMCAKRFRRKQRFFRRAAHNMRPPTPDNAPGRAR